MPSPTARTLKYLRDRGYVAEVVERWNPHSRTRKDLLGWCDIVALGPALNSVPEDDVPQIIGIQCCSGASHAARRTKAVPLAESWRKAGGPAYVVSWSKRGPRGKRKTWQPRIEAL